MIASSYALRKDSVPNCCDACFKSSKDKLDGELSKCAGCRLVRYCDRSCQKTGWRDGHQWECKGFKAYNNVANTFSRILLRIICKLQTTSDYYDVVPPKTHRRFKDLMSHYSDVKNDSVRMEQVQTMIKVVESLLAFHNKITVPNESQMIGLCGKIFVNTFSICNDELQDTGSGLYIGASIFDHSCEPMAVAIFHSTTIEIRNIVPLPSGFPVDKITICYQDSLRPSIVRVPELKKGYYFECKCERCSVQKFDSEMLSIYCSDEEGADGRKCEMNPKHYDKCPKCGTEFSLEYILEIARAEEMILQKINEMTTITYLDVCESCILVMNSNNFSDTHWMKTNMAYSAFEACIEKKYWNKAFDYGQLALKGQRKYLLGLNPYLGISLLKMAKLSWFLEKDQLAREYLSEAYKILSVTHSNSDLMESQIRPLILELSASGALNLNSLVISE